MRAKDQAGPLFNENLITVELLDKARAWNATADIRNPTHCRLLVFRLVSHWPCKRIFVLPALGWLHPARQWIERSRGWDLTTAPHALVFPMAVRNLCYHVVVSLNI